MPEPLRLLSARLPARFQRNREPASPDAALFSGIRWRLAVWYSAVLAVALILFGVILYANVQRTLIGPIDTSLKTVAVQMGQQWRNNSIGFPGFAVHCAGRDATGATQLYVCYDSTGTVIDASPIAAVLPAFNAADLARAALHSGQAYDTVDTQSEIGRVRRFAIRVPDATGQHTLGVIEVGTPIGTQQDTLTTLRSLLLLLGLLVLLAAAGGGLFLAHLALAPARVAHTRQRTFIADASHELRTPLTMLRADAEVLLRRRQSLDPDDAALLDDVVAEAAHMTSLANAMLDLARLDAGQVQIEQEVLDLGAIAADVARRAGPLAAEHGISIKLEGDGRALVYADALLLDQVALILVDNAIKYNHPDGTVTVRTWQDGRGAHLEVRDTGIGIAAEHLTRLGERFYRVDKARTREQGGAGLGLSLARAIVERHGGSLDLTSRPDEGTTAVITLPAAKLD